MKTFQKFKSQQLSREEMASVKGGVWVVHYVNGAMSRHDTKETADAWCRNHNGGCFVHEHPNQ